MEGGLGGGLYSSMGSGMLGLEMSVHQNPQNAAPNPQNPHALHHPQIMAYAHQEAHPNGKSTSFHYNSNSSKSKQQLSINSDEDEPGFDGSSGDPKKKASPWQRMKWTDTMVRLLVMAVFYIGDEGGPESNDPKKKSGVLLQKKGKWKSVSRAMMEKGFYVSPQQCEDKFNDLNKRYKRVNDILGKGTACRVVENQALLETMDLLPKLKEEAKKLLNSKHLFFREMCAYHTSCGHGGGAQQSPEMAAAADAAEPPQQQQQQRCFHSVAGGRAEVEFGAKSMAKGGGSSEEDEEDDEDEDDEDEDEDDGEEVAGPASHGHDHNNAEQQSRKRQRKCCSLSSVLLELTRELMAVVQDLGKNPLEKRQWMKMKLLNLEEQQVSYQGQAYELERQRLKWVKFSSKKEREMERAKLENERRRLENDRMVLLVRQKELELIDIHHQQQQQNCSHKRSDPSSITG